MKSLLNLLRYGARLTGILFILARYDALFVLRAARFPAPILFPLRPFVRTRSGLRPGERLAGALEQMGPSFIKLGQALSTRADVIGEDIARDLANLRDRVPPFPGTQAVLIIEAEFGKPISEIFAEFDEQSVAAASIAQVHFAILPGGKEVAVKVLRPYVEEAFARDLALFAWLADIAERYFPAWRRLKPREVVKTLQNTVAFELDLRDEAAAAEELRENAKGDLGVVIPAIHWELTTRRVLTMDRIAGIPLGDVEALRAAGHDLDGLLGRASVHFFNQVFRDGLFHADLHPGNLFATPEGAIAMVDFGIVGRLDEETRLYVAEILHGFLQGDFRRVADVHIEAGYVPADTSAEQFALACRAIARPVLGKPLNEVSAANLLAQLFRVTERFQMETQPQLLLLQKSMMMMEGLGRLLNPKVNMWQLAEPMITQWAKDEFGLRGQVQRTLAHTLQGLRRLPALLTDVEEVLETIARGGGLRLHPESLLILANARRASLRPWLVALVGLALLILTVVILRT